MTLDYQSPVGLHSIDNLSGRLCIAKQALMISPCQHSGAVHVRPLTAEGSLMLLNAWCREMKKEGQRPNRSEVFQVTLKHEIA